MIFMNHACHIDLLMKEAGLRCTQDRHDLLSVFLSDRAWSAAHIAKEFPKKDLSTIYRNLQKLAHAGIIQAVHTHADEEFFERTALTHHDHAVCQQCHRMECIPCPVKKIGLTHLLEIQQLCESCV